MIRLRHIIHTNIFILAMLTFLLFSGCAGQRAIKRDITTHLNDVGMIRPYVSEVLLEADADFVVDLLVDHLKSQGAKILTSDKKSGIVSWYDAGGYFYPLLETKGDQVKTYGLVQGKVSSWRGFVFGCAHVIETKKAAWLIVRISGRSVKSGQAVFSDGTYEWRLISAMDRLAHQAATGQKIVRESRDQTSASPRGRARNYKDLFDSYFLNFSGISRDSIIETSEGYRYIVPADRLWQACLDVVAQYALIPYLKSDEKVIVFARRKLVPVNMEKQIFKPVDVLLALTIKAEENESEKSSKVFVSLLGKNDLIPRVINQKLSSETDDTQIDLCNNPLDTAATISLNEMLKHIDAQLYYNENLGNKLFRRLRQ